MDNIGSVSPHTLVVLSVLILSWGELTQQQHPKGMLIRQLLPLANKNKTPPAPPVMCTQDSLVIYQDCRLCICPRPNRVAKCFKKSCDLRTKDDGQCPQTILKMDDGRNCEVEKPRGCKVDADCPGKKLCCFDFCGSPKCTDPVPLDAASGTPVHGGRGYQ